MVDSVDKLKEILFQQESATLVDLEQRIAGVARAEEMARAQITEGRALLARLERRLSDLDERTGTPEALRRSVTEVIDEVITDARETKQEDLSRALAPMLVKTIKAELKNNQAEMVEALYPITGQLVKSYVASAMRDLTNRLNRGLQSNGFMLRLRSLFSGYSMAELRLAETQRLEVEELYLIRRGSGELLQRFPESLHRSNSDAHMSGMIAAINDFAANAFQGDGGNLRSFDVDDFTLFLRASPVYLLAAKCRGVAAPGVEGSIDEEFLAVVPQLHEADVVGSQSATPARLLADLKTRVESSIEEKHEELSRAGLPFNPVRALAALLVLGIVSGLGWYAFTSWEIEQTRQAARTTIEANQAMKGYPVVVEVGPRGRSIAVSGLAPNETARASLMQQLGGALPGVEISDRGLAALPSQGPDLSSQLAEVRRELGTVERQAARAAAVRSLERARLRLQQMLPDLALLSSLQAPARRKSIEAAQADAERTIATLGSQINTLRAMPVGRADDASIVRALSEAAAVLRRLAADLTGLIGQRPPQSVPPVNVQGDVSDHAEVTALAAERLAAVTAAAVQAASIRIPDPPQISQPTPRELLRGYAQHNAIFFANNEDYRDQGRATTIIGEVARLAKSAGVMVRVIGYTDERGGLTRNTQLAQSRAEKVAQGLIAQGVPRNMVVAVGRVTGPDLSPATGPDSPNRRVEFEVGFDGEPLAGP